jgi:hypothetical protein
MEANEAGEEEKEYKRKEETLPGLTKSQKRRNKKMMFQSSLPWGKNNENGEENKQENNENNDSLYNENDYSLPKRKAIRKELKKNRKREEKNSMHEHQNYDEGIEEGKKRQVGVVVVNDAIISMNTSKRLLSSLNSMVKKNMNFNNGDEEGGEDDNDGSGSDDDNVNVGYGRIRKYLMGSNANKNGYDSSIKMVDSDFDEFEDEEDDIVI